MTKKTEVLVDMVELEDGNLYDAVQGRHLKNPRSAAPDDLLTMFKSDDLKDKNAKLPR